MRKPPARSQLVIRPASERDIEGITRLYRSAVDGDYKPQAEEIPDFINSGGMLVAHDSGGRIVGARTYEKRKIGDKFHMMFNFVFVHPDYRKGGLGKQLNIEALERIFSDKSVPRVSGNILKPSPSAERKYRSIGATINEIPGKEEKEFVITPQSFKESKRTGFRE